MPTSTKAKAVKSVKDYGYKYEETPKWYKELIGYSLKNGVLEGLKYGHKALKEGKVKHPAHNPYHAMKMAGTKDKETLVKAYYILAVKKDNPTGNTHVLDIVEDKLKKLYSKEELKAAVAKYIVAKTK